MCDNIGCTKNKACSKRFCLHQCTRHSSLLLKNLVLSKPLFNCCCLPFLACLRQTDGQRHGLPVCLSFSLPRLSLHVSVRVSPCLFPSFCVCLSLLIYMTCICLALPVSHCMALPVSHCMALPGSACLSLPGSACLCLALPVSAWLCLSLTAWLCLSLTAWLCLALPGFACLSLPGSACLSLLIFMTVYVSRFSSY